MKKQTTILLSALVLTGFYSPIIQTTNTQAAIVRDVNDMVPSGKVLHFGEKFELSDLKEEACIPIKAYA